MNIPQRQQAVDIKNTTPIKCQKCEGQVFLDAVMMRKVSALVSPTGREAVSAIPVFICAKCQAVIPELLPQELKDGLSLG